MNLVEIINMKIEGMGSYAVPQVFQFHSTGLFSVQGKNGSGKSTLFHALRWVFYKELPSDWTASAMKSAKRIQPEGYKGTRVQCNFKVNGVRYMIARHADFKGETLGVEGGNSLMLFRNREGGKIAAEHMVGDQLYKDDQQAYINSLLGVDAETFNNSIIFGQKMKRLIGADAKEKRELFEQLFDLAFIETAKDNADKRLAELNAEIAQLQTKEVKLETLIEAEQSAIDSHRQIDANYETTKAERIEELRVEFNAAKERKNAVVLEIQELTDSVEALKEQIEAIPEAKGEDPQLTTARASMRVAGNKVSETQNLIGPLKIKVNELKQNIGGIDNQIRGIDSREAMLAKDLREVSDTCTLCGAKIKPEKLAEVKTNIESQITKCKSDVLAMRDKRGDVNKALDLAIAKYDEAVAENDAWELTYQKAVKDVNALIAKQGKSTEPAALQLDLARKEERVIERGKDLARYQADMAKIRTKKEAIQAETPVPFDYEEREKKIEDWKHDKLCASDRNGTLCLEADKVQWWIKKGFSAGGLKGYIFGAMLEKLNELVGKYAIHFGYGVVFSVDTTKASKPFVTTVYAGDDIEQPYGQFSGGQKQRIDVCLAFAMHELVGYKTKFNIAVFDEVSDGLDAEGMEMVNNVITEASQDKGIYVVSHNPIFVPQSASTITITGGLREHSVITRHND